MGDNTIQGERSSPERDNHATVLIHDRQVTPGTYLIFSWRNRVGEQGTRCRRGMGVRHRLGQTMRRGGDGSEHRC